jgi:UDP-glucose 4-epimerase
MKNILVTGGCGFVGSNLIKLLLDNKFKVYCIDNQSKGKTKIKGCVYINKNIININQIKYKIDCIVHLAAIARIQPSFKDPKSYWINNCDGTFSVVDYAKINKIPIIYAGSSSHHGGRFKNPYTFTKDIGEDIVRLYEQCYNIKATIVRFYNVYGPGECLDDEYSTIIGNWRQKLINNLPFVIFGDGSKKRDFTHIDDITDAIIKIINKKAFGYTFELGRGKPYSINKLLKLFKYNKVIYKPDRKGEVKNNICDYSLAKKILGWKPKKNIEDYIKEIKSTRA